jgi:hypothetical protein
MDKLQAYVVNLDARPKNLQRFMSALQEQPEELTKDILHLQRFSAVDMTGITRGVPVSDVDKRRRMAKVSPFATWTMMQAERRYHQQFLGAGAIGCYLSHVAIWEKVAASDDERGALVFEDDARINRPADIASVLRRAQRGEFSDPSAGVDLVLLDWVNLKSIDADDVVELGEPSGSVELVDGVPMASKGQVLGYRIVQPFFSTAMYYLNRRAAIMLLERALPIEIQVDGYISVRASEVLSEALGITPLKVYGARGELGARLAHQHNPTGSSIGHDGCTTCDSAGETKLDGSSVEMSVVLRLLAAIAIGLTLATAVLIIRRKV